jgi:hypothetical protein
LISFESNSQLKQIESEAFARAQIRSVLLPPHIAFIARDAFPVQCKTSLSDDSCAQLRKWISLREEGSSPDFERIQEFKYGTCTASKCVAGLSLFEMVKVFSNHPRVPVRLLANRATGNYIAVKSDPVLSVDE